jgi:YD repeat-containing protein
MTRYQRGYDLNGNVTSRRLRDGTSIGFSFDFLDRTIAKDLPGTDPDGAYTYDLLGRLTGATQGTESAAFTYDALGRKLTETGLLGTMQSLWDAAGRRTRLTWPDGTYVDYDHLVTGETSAVRQNGATSGIGVLATYGYDGLGRRTSLTRGNGMATSYAYTGPQLTGLSHDLAGSSFDVAFGFTYNPAGQIVTRTASNTAYAYTAMGSGSLAYGINGLNQTTAVGAATITSDGRGNLTSDGTNSYTFSSENRVTGLITGSITTALGYDPLGRWTKGGASIWLGWDGDAMVIEKLGSAATKWVHGGRRAAAARGPGRHLALDVRRRARLADRQHAERRHQRVGDDLRRIRPHRPRPRCVPPRLCGAGVDRQRPELRKEPRLQPQPRPVPADGPDWLWGRDEYVQLCRIGSRQLPRSLRLAMRAYILLLLS